MAIRFCVFRKYFSAESFASFFQEFRIHIYFAIRKAGSVGRSWLWNITGTGCKEGLGGLGIYMKRDSITADLLIRQGEVTCYRWQIIIIFVTLKGQEIDKN